MRSRLVGPVAVALVAVAALGGCPAATPPAATVMAARPSPTSPPAVTAPPLRLPRLFVPTQYALRLAVDPARADLTGAVAIDGTIAAATSVIWLHGEGLTIAAAHATRGGADVALTVIPHAPDVLELRAARLLEPGAWTVQLDYTAPLDVIGTTGAFKQTVAGAAYVYTQLEAVYARRVVPCVDEPDSKVPWQLTLDVPTALVAVSNTPVAREAPLAPGTRRVEFAPTPPLPSYLVAFAVGPFEIVDAGRSGGGTPVRVIALAGRRADAGHAAATAPRILDLAEAWFGTPYPYAKLDLLAIPLTVGFGAMENAGLVTFQETLVLVGDGGSQQRKLWWSTVAAHEIAHQWFGNLVTMAFWDDIWLNEGFANWLEGKLVAEFAPAWHPPDETLTTRNAALDADALVSARRVRQPIVTADDIAGVFDSITYDKGASVLAMFESYLGPDVFQRGVRAYLAARAWGNATSSDFVRALGAAAGQDLAPAFATFLDQPGAPELTAELVCGGAPAVRLTQRHHVPPGAPAPVVTRPWTIPVCVAYERAGARAEACTLLATPTATLPLDAARCPRWLLPNARGRGYYRLAYTTPQIVALRDEAWPLLTQDERRVLMFDVAQGARTGGVALPLALSLAPRLIAAGDRFSVEDALALPGELQAFVPAAQRERYEGWLRGLAGPAARAAGLVPAATDTLDLEVSRERLIGLVGGAGRDPALRTQAVALAQGWRALPPSIRGTVLRLAADADAGVFAQLLREVATEPDRVRREELFEALGGVRDPGRLAQALALLLDPAIDARESIALLGSLPDDATHTQAQAFVRTHARALLARLPTDGTIDSGTSLGTLFAVPCRAEVRADVAAVLRQLFGALRGSGRALAQQLEEMDQCIARRQVLEPALRGWLAGLKLPRP